MRSLAIGNIDAIREEAILMSFASSVVESVVLRSRGSSAALLDPRDAPHRGWSVLQDLRGTGIAIHVGEIIPSDTVLAEVTTRLRSAQTVSRFLEGLQPRALLMQEQDVLSPEWRVVVLRFDSVCAWFGVVGDWRVWAKEQAVSSNGSQVRMSLVAHSEQEIEVVVGQEIKFSELRVVLEESGLTGKILPIEGERMSIQFDEDAEREFEWTPGVSLELGELEMKLEDLLALKPGHNLEIASPHPARVYLRVGRSQLAVGQLELREGGLVVKVTEIL